MQHNAATQFFLVKIDIKIQRNMPRYKGVSIREGKIIVRWIVTVFLGTGRKNYRDYEQAKIA
jgi:hypothetical protein